MKGIVLLITVGFATSLFAQTPIIKLSHNKCRWGDRLLKWQVEYKDPGNSGENILWDYSSLKIVDDNYKIRYRENETDTAGYVENAHNTSYYYRITRDSLFLDKYVNGTTRMIYTLPELKLTYPFNYKDSINSPLAAKGNYCGKLPLHISGNSETTADAFGKLITPEGDTLSVLRLHNKTILQQTDTNKYSIQKQTYTWFARGYRYPVFETIQTQIIHPSRKNIYYSSFYFPPEENANMNPDPINEKELQEMAFEKALADSIAASKEKEPEYNEWVENIRLYPQPVKDFLKIEYHLKKETPVQVYLYDSGFRLIKIISQETLPTGNHTRQIDMQEYQPGEYHIHLIFGNYIEKRTVLKSL